MSDRFQIDELEKRIAPGGLGGGSLLSNDNSFDLISKSFNGNHVLNGNHILNGTEVNILSGNSFGGCGCGCG